MAKKKKKLKINFNDPEFSRKLSIYYSWIAPVVLFLVACVIIYGKAYLTGLILILLSVFISPVGKKYTAQLHKSLRWVIIAGLLALTYYSLYLYG